jgi:plastocyanin
MAGKRSLARAQSLTVAITVVAALMGFGTAACFSLATTVSQKGRVFTPGQITIPLGEVIQILNDDGDLRHHAYVDSDKFNFDSGDQEPGSKTSITFPVAGNFEVLCAIHPKMKLLVRVQER